MIDATASLQLAERVSAATLIEYLRVSGWSSRPSRVAGIAIFSKRISGADNPVQFILPVEPTFPDERRRVADALRTLAQIEGCSEAEIANKVRQTSSPSRGLESKNADVLKSKKDTSIVMSGKTDSSVTNDAIESTAQHLRESLGLSDQSVFNIVELLENDMPKAIKGFRLQVVATCEAQEIYSTKVPPRIFATEHVYDLARRGDARSRVMIAHELAHLLLHQQSFNFRTLSQSSAANSTESEALKFALAFLIPSSVARGFNDPNLLSLYCKVDRKAAETRMRYVRENMEARDF